MISTLTRDTVLGLECLAIWKNADAYLAAFGGQPPEAGSNRGRSSETHPRQGSREVRLPLPLAVCHSDSVTVQGLMPGTTYPRMPGHEVIGVVRRSDPTCLAGTWACGSVWFGGACGYCARCRGGQSQRLHEGSQVRCRTMKTSRPWSYQTYEYPPATEREDGCSRGFGATDAALLGRPEGLCAQLRACGGTRPRERAGVRDAFILDTLASIDGMCWSASHSSSPTIGRRPARRCRPLRSEPAPGLQ